MKTKNIIESKKSVTHAQFAVLRRNMGITQVTLASYISQHFKKCSSRTVSRWETGRNKLPQYAIVALTLISTGEQL